MNSRFLAAFGVTATGLATASPPFFAAMNVRAILAVVVLAGCSAANRPETAAEPADITGSWRFTTLNGSALPVEFPAGSGQRLETGSLEMRPNRTYVMRFGMRAPGTDVANYGNDGTYRMSNDTVFFIPEPRASLPPVIFRFERQPATLRLVDEKGNLWVYVPR